MTANSLGSRNLLQAILRTAAIGALAIVTLATGDRATARTWAETLGYPPEARVLIIHASQMGMSFETSHAGKQLLERGIVQSVDAMPPCPWFGEFSNWARENSKYDVGVSLTFTGEAKHYRWGPISPRSEVESLVDGDGFLPRASLQFINSADPEQVEQEMEAQLNYARKAGIRPGHLTAHQGILYLRTDLAKRYLNFAQKHWIPAVVVELTPEKLGKLREDGFPIQDEMVDLIAQYPLPKVDDFQIMPAGEHYEQKRDNFMQMVRGLSPGITQIVALPATESEALKQIDPNWQQRVWDAKLLSDPEVEAFLKSDGIVLTNWQEMMRRFEGEAVPRIGEGAREPEPAESSANDLRSTDVETETGQ